LSLCLSLPLSCPFPFLKENFEAIATDLPVHTQESFIVLCWKRLHKLRSYKYCNFNLESSPRTTPLLPWISNIISRVPSNNNSFRAQTKLILKDASNVHIVLINIISLSLSRKTFHSLSSLSLFSLSLFPYVSVKLSLKNFPISLSLSQIHHHHHKKHYEKINPPSLQLPSEYFCFLNFFILYIYILFI
jgi:hypothetical protein